MSRLIIPRYTSASAALPGNPLFWETVLNQSDLFAYITANEGKGGPFGAQLWLVKADIPQYILVGTNQEPEDSNAVVSKGRASAHAEAENLSPRKRDQVVRFLESRTGQGWQVVQVSSGESCPSCRSKQIAFANELIAAGLIAKGDFHVAFKATYDQTKRDAGFNDAPYDQTFRAIGSLGILEDANGLFGLENMLVRDPVTAAQIQSGELVYNAVVRITSGALDTAVKEIFNSRPGKPVAVIVRADGSLLSYAADERIADKDAINIPEETAIVSALYAAAGTLRDDENKFDAWNLEGARLYTNIRDIGPVAYAESLWYNLCDIHVITDYASDLIDMQAREVPGISNNDLFRQAAAEYDSPLSPLSVTFGGDRTEANVAHLLWKARTAMENLKVQQAKRLKKLEMQGTREIGYIDGTTTPLSDLVSSSHLVSHYDGKQAR